MIKIIFLLLVAGNAMAIEQPSYSVILENGKFEIRSYPRHIVAETIVRGEFDNVGNRAFRRLGGYIFGSNDADKKISMTAPVTQQATDDGYFVRFYMPVEHDLSDLPEPLDNTVTVRESAGGTFAVISYKGGWKQKLYLEQKSVLLEELEQHPDWIVSGEPIWARYNSPMMPAFLRLNEILIPIVPR
ncbi:MAG: hypothetical protein ACI9VI_002484 [Candidatus Azotimanducaceae bacterium]|jgi:hypothetical protein